MSDIAELHRKEWKEFYADYQNSKVELEASQRATEIAQGYGKDKLPQYWVKQMTQDKETWNAEWGFGGRRYREMLKKQAQRQSAPVPDILTDSYLKCDQEGRKLLLQLGAQYEKERDKLIGTTFVQKQHFQRDWIRLTGTGKLLTEKEVLAPLQFKYVEMAKNVVADSLERQEMLSAKQEEKLDRKQKFLANARAMRLKQGGNRLRLKN